MGGSLALVVWLLVAFNGHSQEEIHQSHIAAALLGSVILVSLGGMVIGLVFAIMARSRDVAEVVLRVADRITGGALLAAGTGVAILLWQGAVAFDSVSPYLSGLPVSWLGVATLPAVALVVGGLTATRVDVMPGS